MSTPNPLAPQGSFLEKHGRGRSTFQIISFIGAIHVVALCGLLWIGCKKDDQGTGLAGNTDAAGSGLGALPGDPGLPLIGGTGAGLPGDTNPPLPGYTGVPPVPTNAYYGGPVTGAGAGAAPGSLDPAGLAGGGGLAPGGIDTGAAPLTPATPTEASEYKVQKGDMGTTIARKHGVSLTALKAANPTIDWNRLKVNQVIALPAKTGSLASTGGAAPAGSADPTGPADGGTSYTVRPGDTGTKIARKFGVSWKSIRNANNLSSDVLRPNQKLTIPAKGSAATAPVANPPSAGSGPTATPLPALPGQ